MQARKTTRQWPKIDANFHAGSTVVFRAVFPSAPPNAVKDLAALVQDNVGLVANADAQHQVLTITSRIKTKCSKKSQHRSIRRLRLEVFGCIETIELDYAPHVFDVDTYEGEETLDLQPA